MILYFNHDYFNFVSMSILLLIIAINLTVKALFSGIQLTRNFDHSI